MNARCRTILEEKNAFAINWNKADFEELHEVFAKKDCFGLNKILARDDLRVRSQKTGTRPLSHFLVEKVILGPCIFDLHHPWTKERILSKLEIDIDREMIERKMVPALPACAVPNRRPRDKGPVS